MTNSIYNINFSDYFFIKESKCNIIYDSNKIKYILSILERPNNVYPTTLDFKLIDLFDQSTNLTISNNFIYKEDYSDDCFYKNTQLHLPDHTDKTFILHSKIIGGNGFLFFEKLLLNDKVKQTVKQTLTKLKEPYLCIHVRNTDLTCDYKKLYKDNKQYIHSFNSIYICTDDKEVVTFFKNTTLNIHCFTTFPSDSYYSLHYTTDISPHTKMMDVINDIFIATNSKGILSNSDGGFIHLLQNCYKHKQTVLPMLL
jgi:hypothetical protein